MRVIYGYDRHSRVSNANKQKEKVYNFPIQTHYCQHFDVHLFLHFSMYDIQLKKKTKQKLM